MKKILWLFCLVLVAISCKDDDDPKNVNIEGTWVFISEVYADCDDPDENFSDEDPDGCDDGYCTTITFAGGNYVMTFLDDGDPTTVEGTYTVKGSTITVDGEAATATRSGNTLTVVIAEDSDGCKHTIVATLVE